MICTQNIQIFPGAFISLLSSSKRLPSDLPDGVENIFIKTTDNEHIEIWKLEVPGSKKVALIFHGNGGDVANFFPYQKYFQSIGISSYGVDYRGYGKSSGWPSEKGLYIDGKSAMNYLLKHENSSEKDVIVVGISIGSGAAAHVAKHSSPGALVIFSPFTSLPDLVKTMPLFGILHPFTLYTFPVKDDVQSLENTCLIVTHGEKDTVIPHSHGKAVFSAYRGSSYNTFINSSEAGHNDILFKVYSKLTDAIENCFEKTK